MAAEIPPGAKDAPAHPAVSSDTDDSGSGPGSVGAPKPFVPTREFVLAFCSLLMVVLAVAFDATTLGVALPVMSTDLTGTALQAFWSGTGFLLASAVFQPTIASLSFIFGRSHLIYVASLLFAVGSIIAAVANSFTLVIAGRVIQGGGGGGIIALTEIIVTDLVPLAARGQWFSILSGVWSVGTVAGPLIGAGFAQDVTWRWIFWINLPIIAVGVIMVFVFLKQARVPGRVLEKLGRFDFVGCLLFTAGSTSFLFGLSSGGVMYEWKDARTLVSMVVGAAVMVAFGFWEVLFAGRFGTEPLVNRGIFNNWTMISTYIQSVLHGAILWSLIYFLVLYYQAIKFYSPVISAVAALPETLTVAPSAIVVGVVASITGRYRWALWSGWVIATLGCGIMYLLGPQTSVAQWVFLNIPVGVGTGMVFPATSLAMQAACPPELNAEAAAFFSFLRTFGQSVGVAVSGVIFQNAFKSELQAVPAFAERAAELSRDATIVVGVINGMAAGPEKDALVGAYNEGLKAIWITLTAVSAVSMFLSFTVRGFSLQQKHVTKQAFQESESPLEGQRVGDAEKGEKRQPA